MRPTVGHIISGIALGTVATAMIVAPERTLVADESAVPGLELQVADARRIVRVAPLPSTVGAPQRRAPRRVVAPLHRPPRSPRPPSRRRHR
jgi:hypothetical protein